MFKAFIQKWHYAALTKMGKVIIYRGAIHQDIMFSIYLINNQFISRNCRSC